MATIIQTIQALLQFGAQASNANNVPAGTRFTYQEGGVQGGGIYTSMRAAYEAAAAVRALRPTIVVDGTLGTPTFGSGAYDLGNMIFVSAEFNNNFTVEIPDGVQLSLTAYDNLTLDQITFEWFSTSAPCFAIANGLVAEVNMLNGSFIEQGTGDTTATKAFFSVDGTSSLLLNLQGFFTGILGGVGAPVIDVASGGGATVNVAQGASVDDDSLHGLGTWTINLFDMSATPGFPQLSTVQPGFSPDTLSVNQGPSNALIPLALSNAGGAQTLPTRPSLLAAPKPSTFLAEPTGNLAGSTTYTLNLIGYQAGDIVRILFTKAQLNGHDVTVADGGGTGTLTQLLNASTGASGIAYAEFKFVNIGFFHWIVIAGGYN